MKKYIIIPDKLKIDTSVIPAAKLVYGDILLLSNKQGYCFAGNSYFCDLYNVSVNCVTRWLKSLQNNGYIKIQYKKKNELSSRRIYITRKCEQHHTKSVIGITQKGEHNNTRYNKFKKSKVII
tara:strand:- start:429 stop:797 length:369 start_codon:yes stop_codon:yes gene_type:complete